MVFLCAKNVFGVACETMVMRHINGGDLTSDELQDRVLADVDLDEIPVGVPT